MRTSVGAVLTFAAVATSRAPIAAADPATLGTAHPVRLLAASPDARWAIVCEARADTDHDGTIAVAPGFNGLYGDQMAGFLILGSGAGAPIDAFVAADPTGRYVVILRKQKLVLVDTSTRAEVDLSARGAYDKPVRDASGAYLGVSFDDAGKHLTYVTNAHHHAAVVVRELAARTDVAIDPGDGKLWGATLDPSGAHVMIDMLVARGNQPVVFPHDYERQPKNAHVADCATRTSGDSFSYNGPSPTVPTMRIAAVTGGAAVDSPGFLTYLGGATLRREPTGALALADSTGAREQLPAACKALVDGFDRDHQRVLAHCTAPADTTLWLLDAHAPPRNLGAHGRSSMEDYLMPFGRHVLWSVRDANDAIFDVDTGATRLAPTNQQIESVLGDRTLVERGGRAVLLDGASETDLGDIGTQYPTMLAAGTMRVLGPLVIDLALGKVVGRVPERPASLGTVTATVFAVAADGRLLGTFATKPSGFPDGPLAWLTPAAP